MSEQTPFQNIYGSEMEWPMSAVYVNERGLRQLDLDPAEHRDAMTRSYLPHGLVSLNDFLSNGARYYKDVGGKVEYATPENTSSMGLVRSEFAGEWVVAECLRRYIEARDDIQYAFMTKRVIDSNDSNRGAWGYHINISEDRKAIRSLKDDTLPVVAHLATSLPMIGGGAVYYDRKAGEHKYSFGQKVLAPINSDYSTGTTNRSKPLINLRDETHADPNKYRRVHIVGVDPHISPWASWMSFGTLALTLAISRQKLGDGLALAGTDAATRASIIAATDLEMNHKYEMVDGSKYTALDIQEKLIEAAGKVRDRTEEQDAILAEWQRAHGILKNRPEDLVESDAIKKLELVKADMRRRGKAAMDAGSMGVDIAYTVLFRATKDEAASMTTEQIMAKSVPGRLRSGLYVNHMPPEELIRHGIYNPPETTRAYTRGTLIKDAALSKVDWSGHTRLDSAVPVQVKEPLEGACPENERTMPY